jgi:hypothetical protein
MGFMEYKRGLYAVSGNAGSENLRWQLDAEIISYMMNNIKQL